MTEFYDCDLSPCNIVYIRVPSTQFEAKVMGTNEAHLNFQFLLLLTLFYCFLCSVSVGWSLCICRYVRARGHKWTKPINIWIFFYVISRERQCRVKFTVIHTTVSIYCCVDPKNQTKRETLNMFWATHTHTSAKYLLFLWSIFYHYYLCRRYSKTNKRTPKFLFLCCKVKVAKKVQHKQKEQVEA